MRDNLRNYFLRNFSFSNSEIRGIYIVIPFILASFIAPIIFQKYLSEYEEVSKVEEELLDQWIFESKLKLNREENKRKEELKVFAKQFDPNTINVEQWVEKGFSEKIAKRIKKYLDKGGRFNKKEDVLKVYGIDNDLARAYFDYIDIVPTVKKKATKASKFKKTKIPNKEVKELKKPPLVIFDLNSVDTTGLKSIRGIGSYYSTKLVEYRNKLGGFIHEDQLLEIYGLDTAVQSLILKQAKFEPVIPQQININVADFDEMFKHPYLNYKSTVAIIKYRKQNGPYNHVEDLEKVLILKDSIYLKVKPYLKVSD